MKHFPFDAQTELNAYLESMDLKEATQEQLNEWYSEAIKGAAPVPEIQLEDWQEHHGYVSKELYVYGEGLEFFNVDSNTLFYNLRVEFGLWVGQEHPSLEVYDE
jgi:hypothetical protein